MRNKTAYVSQKEVPFPRNAVLISRTDCKGMTTYVNDVFVAISGYAREELIGSNHNIVRHPDMPPQAFKWLWDTLKDERAWCGTVKNRCKNGDHYWVQATVAPLYENGAVSGYSSVRRAPTREQIAQAEALYKELMQSGKPIESKFARYRFKYWSLSHKLQFALQSILMIVLSLGQYFIFADIKRNQHKASVAEAVQLSRDVSAGANMLMLSGMTQNEQMRNSMLATIKSEVGVDSVRLLRIPDTGASGATLDAVQREVIESGKQKIISDANSTSLRVLTPLLSSKNSNGMDCTRCHAGSEGKVLGLSDIVLNETHNMAATSRLEMRVWFAQLVLQVFLYFYIAALLRKYVSIPAKQAETGFEHLMQGDLTYDSDISGRDEFGRILCRIRTLQSYLRTLVDEIVTPIGVMRKRVDSMDYKVNLVAMNAAKERNHIDQVAVAIEEFSHSVAQASGMSATSLTNAQGMQHLIEKNNRNMERSIGTISRVGETVQSASQTIAELGASIQKIGVITNTINEIAKQTNLLALNAAIEAARAGELGRGFAVVAAEVRKLADRTSASTKDIAITINQITSISTMAGKSMHQAVADVGQGIAQIRCNGADLKEIQSVSDSVTLHIDQIVHTSREHSECGKLMTSSIGQINDLVKSNAEQAREAKVDCNDLMRLALGLRLAGYPLTKGALE